MELAWLAETPHSNHRRRVLRACPQCQIRKKRCRHVEPVPSPSRSRIINRRQHKSASDGTHPSAASSASESTASPKTPGPIEESTRPDRFLGAMNPEALIREKLDAATNVNPRRDRIGLWITSPVAERRQKDAQDGAISVSPYPVELQTIADQLRQKHESALTACMRLPFFTLHHLIPMYFLKVNHILPIVDQDAFLTAQAEGTVSPFLERAICLVAAKDKAAAPYLRLHNNGPVVLPAEFCTDIYRGLSVVINEGLEPDRITRIRVLALMSLHCEDSEGTEAASMHLYRAVHQAQAVGLHLVRPGNTEHPLSGLFWCLWTLDKTHACMGGRAVLLADQDISIKKPAAIRNQLSRPRTAFEVWFAISDLLSDVIYLYRPGADHTSRAARWEKGFPNFDEIIGCGVDEDIDIGTLAGFLELFYHVVGILFARNHSPEHTESPSPFHIRQDHAAIRIQSIAAREYIDELPPLPIVPYALSLSMGVSYQQYRSSNLITHLSRSKADLEARCSLLEILRPYWYSADKMAQLGRKALNQIQEGPGLPTLSAMQAPETGIRTEASQGNRITWVNSTSTDVMGENTTNVAQGARSDIQELGLGGFADIDVLFGDFLDLSLPNGFWDPDF
ncbi:fungal specific transcription factor domain-containing protein, partial [Aspergillus ibericus CBS 121593]